MVASPVVQATPVYVLLPSMTPEDKARIKLIKDAWRGYRGEFDPLLDKEEGSPDFNIYDNRLAPIVDKGVSWLFGQAITITIRLTGGEDSSTSPEADGAAPGTVPADALLDAANPPEPGTPQTLTPQPEENPNAEAQAWLDDVLGDDDDRMTLFADGAHNGGVSGHSFWKLVPADPNDPDSTPHIVALNSELCWCETDPDDCKEILAYNIQYPVTDPTTNKTVIRRQRIARNDPDADEQLVGEPVEGMWTIGNYQSTDQSSNKWQQMGELEPWADPKTGEPWKFPPIVENPNLPNPNELWGRPDTTPDIIGMNRNINLVQSIIAKLLWFYSSPILWSNLDQRQIIRARPGFVTGLGPNGTMNAIEAHGDIAAILAFVATLRSNMDEQSKVPAVAFGRLQDLNIRAGSGVALRLLMQPLIEKTEMKRRLYGRSIRDLCQRLLALGGYGDGESMPIDIGWPTLVPVDEVTELQGAVLKQQLGYPEQMIVTGLGDDYTEWLAQKQKEDQAKQASYDMGMGPAPQANAFGQQPMPTNPAQPPQPMNPQQLQGLNHPAAQAQRNKLTGGQ